jgi:tripartite-type tricarboxylate transporter receptor subunit TctC
MPLALRHARADSYPDHPVRIIVGYAAGGPTDIAGRLVSEILSKRFGQQFAVEDKPGAGSNLGTELVVNSPPDGYTLLLVTQSNAINATLYGNLSYDFMRDITPVASLLHAPSVLVINPSVPAKTIPELIAYAKANPGKLSYASAGIGTPSHLAGQLFNVMTGANLTHIPYKGDGPAMADFIGGQVPVMFATLVVSAEHIRAGQIRALAVTTSKRSDAFPDLPSISEFVPGYEASSWFGIGAPAGTPVEIIDTLNREANAGLADPTIRARLATMGCMELTGTAADFGKLIADETQKWGKLIRDAGIRPQ